MMLIVDKIENDLVVCEDENHNMISINLKEFIDIPNEGDVIELIEGEYAINKEETDCRKKNIEQKFYKLFK